MRLSGATTVHAPPDRVQAALTDPEVLGAAIPGCRRFEPVSPHAYEFTVTGGVASIEGSYSGQIRLDAEHTPGSLTFAVSCAGDGGTVEARVNVALTADGEGLTQLSYDADAEVGGALAGVGQLLLTEAAKRLAADVLSAIDSSQRLQRQGGISAPPAQWSNPAPTVVPLRIRPDGTHAFALGMIAGAAIALAAVLAGSSCGRQAR